MITAVIFDMDGLMFDTESAYSIVHSAMSKKRGKEFTLELKNSFMGKRASEVIEALNVYWGKNENIEISLIILCQLYYSGERYIPRYGDSILYNSELVIQIDNDDISIQKNFY